jgi:queuine tRNA-ribosyltransferase
VRADEMLGARLVTQHNLHFYLELTRQARAHIVSGDYAAWAEATAREMREGDEIGRDARG